MGKSQEIQATAIQSDSSDILEFPTDFAKAVARIQETALQAEKVNRASTGEKKVFLSMNDLYLARGK